MLVNLHSLYQAPAYQEPGNEAIYYYEALLRWHSNCVDEGKVIGTKTTPVRHKISSHAHFITYLTGVWLLKLEVFSQWI